MEKKKLEEMNKLLAEEHEKYRSSFFSKVYCGSSFCALLDSISL